jgi:hypothetical protein
VNKRLERHENESLPSTNGKRKIVNAIFKLLMKEKGQGERESETKRVIKTRLKGSECSLEKEEEVENRAAIRKSAAARNRSEISAGGPPASSRYNSSSIYYKPFHSFSSLTLFLTLLRCGQHLSG